MADEPIGNAATRRYARTLARFNATDRPGDMVHATHEQFVYEDRRSGINFGTIDADGLGDLISSTWTVGSGRPIHSAPEVLATRGERLAAVRFRIDYGDGSIFESISLIELDDDLESYRRLIDLDPDDVDAAIAALDELI